MNIIRLIGVQSCQGIGTRSCLAPNGHPDERVDYRLRLAAMLVLSLS